MVEVAGISVQGTSDGCGCLEDRRISKATACKKLYLGIYGCMVRRANGRGTKEFIQNR